MRLERFTVGPLQANSYLLTDQARSRCVLIDPGDEGERLLAAVAADGSALEAVWLTHAHFDHVGALAEVLEQHPVPVYLHPADLPWLRQARERAAAWGVHVRQPDVETSPLAHGQALGSGELRATVLFTPGHAPGHCGFYLEDHGVLLSGDALFRHSIGRTDLPGGDQATLLRSIERELLTLPANTQVLPGHGPETSIAEETRNNPFLIALRPNHPS